jgi:hypothetical protein
MASPTKTGWVRVPAIFVSVTAHGQLGDRKPGLGSILGILLDRSSGV